MRCVSIAQLRCQLRPSQLYQSVWYVMLRIACSVLGMSYSSKCYTRL